MTDLISRADAIEELQNCIGLIQQDGQDYLDERDIPLLDMAIEALQADAVQGEWLPIKRGDKGYSAGDFKCSICGKPNKCFCLTDFCPNCGARMKGGAE